MPSPRLAGLLWAVGIAQVGFTRQMELQEKLEAIPMDGSEPRIRQMGLSKNRGPSQPPKLDSVDHHFPFRRRPGTTLRSTEQAPLCMEADWKHLTHGINCLYELSLRLSRGCLN